MHPGACWTIDEPLIFIFAMAAYNESNHLGLRGTDIELQDNDRLVSGRAMSAHASAPSSSLAGTTAEGSRSKSWLPNGDPIGEFTEQEAPSDKGETDQQLNGFGNPRPDPEDQLRTVKEDSAPRNRTVRYALRNVRLSD